jgi:hypothetical protein
VTKILHPLIFVEHVKFLENASLNLNEQLYRLIRSAAGDRAIPKIVQNQSDLEFQKRRILV